MWAIHLTANSRVLKSLTSTVGFRGWVAVCGSGNEMDSPLGNYVTGARELRDGLSRQVGNYVTVDTASRSAAFASCSTTSARSPATGSGPPGQRSSICWPALPRRNAEPSSCSGHLSH
jgi:hypothetical protein